MNYEEFLEMMENTVSQGLGTEKNDGNGGMFHVIWFAHETPHMGYPVVHPMRQDSSQRMSHGSLTGFILYS